MEGKNFKYLFLLHIFSTLLILGSMAFDDVTSAEEYENIKILITAGAGLQFSKEDSLRGRNIIYNCDLGLADSGIIRIYDEIHPRDMKSLTVKNCYNITIDNYPYHNDLIKLEKLKITNVTLLKLTGPRQWSYSFVHIDFEVSISNIQFLDIDNFYYPIQYSSVSLKLQNVVIDTLHDLLEDYSEQNFKVAIFHLKNVKVNETKSRALHLKGNSNNILTIEDSHFENIQSDAFVFNGKVQIINNTFSFLDERAFSVNKTSSFLFSGNHIKRMLNPFNITALEVNIINNTFDSITTPWLPKIYPTIEYFRLFNITGNIINHWSHNLLYMDPNFSDVVIFEDNYLNCSCKNAITAAYKTQNYIKEVFLSKQHKNFCYNLGNCPLHKVLKQGSEICSGTFRCPEDQNEDDDDGRMWPSQIKSILSVLKNIDTKLDKIAAKYNSPLVDKPN